MNLTNPTHPPRHKAPEGECEYCDSMRKAGSTFHPPHDPSPRCRNVAAGREAKPHCTCDACF
jgi:hypothetical protein